MTGAVSTGSTFVLSIHHIIIFSKCAASACSYLIYQVPIFGCRHKAQTGCHCTTVYIIFVYTGPCVFWVTTEIVSDTLERVQI